MSCPCLAEDQGREESNSRRLVPQRGTAPNLERALSRRWRRLRGLYLIDGPDEELGGGPAFGAARRTNLPPLTPPRRLTYAQVKNIFAVPHLIHSVTVRRSTNSQSQATGVHDDIPPSGP